jgi:hypothetical protein
MRANMGGQVIATAKGPHTDAALEWFLACVDPDVTR